MKKAFKNGAIGWDMGCKFKIVSRKKWDGDFVYKLRFSANTQRWIEYQSHKHLRENAALCYNDTGSFLGEKAYRFKLEGAKNET